ncbi:hypothetical protein [Nostoc sp.]|uniref:hypothetical protein n=1 Tax=Nostoc sp. TaxID=1180 RepID=UPI002FFB977B
MSLLAINKIYKIIETAELIYKSMASERTKQPVVGWVWFLALTQPYWLIDSNWNKKYEFIGN